MPNISLHQEKMRASATGSMSTLAQIVSEFMCSNVREILIVMTYWTKEKTLRQLQVKFMQTNVGEIFNSKFVCHTRIYMYYLNLTNWWIRSFLDKMIPSIEASSKKTNDG